jgi:hypothetical protein
VGSRFHASLIRAVCSTRTKLPRDVEIARGYHSDASHETGQNSEVSNTLKIRVKRFAWHIIASRSPQLPHSTPRFRGRSGRRISSRQPEPPHGQRAQPLRRDGARFFLYLAFVLPRGISRHLLRSAKRLQFGPNGHQRTIVVAGSRANASSRVGRRRGRDCRGCRTRISAKLQNFF